MLLLSVMTLGIIEATITSATINNSQSITNTTVNPNILPKVLNDNQTITLPPIDNTTIKIENNGFNVDTIIDDFIDIVDDWTINKCTTWQRPPHHIYFQLANVLFFIAFLSPSESYGSLFGRCTLVIGSIIMIMWSYLIECTYDIFIWNCLFSVANIIYLIILMYRLRPIRFEKDIESVYLGLFKPLKVSRCQFQKVLNCMKMIRSLKYQEVYAQEKVTKVDSLSLVLSGKLVVSQNERALHVVFHHQFLDSPEWFGVSTDDYFQVSIMAMEESRVLIWHRDKLKLSIIGDSFLQTVFDHILGRDVVKKLMQVTQVNETIATSNGIAHTNYVDGDDKPVMLLKKNGDHGITALINRQLQEEHAPLLGQHQPKPYMIQKNSAFSAHRSKGELKTSKC